MSRRNSINLERRNSASQERRNSASQERINLDDYEGVIAEKVDLLFEKRKAVREAALSALNLTLSLRYCGETLELRQETLADGLERVLKDLQLEPTLLALKIASLASISIQSGHKEFFTRFKDLLQRLMVNEALETSIRAEAINTLSITCFMATIFDEDHETTTTTSVLDALYGYIFSDLTNMPPDITRAALQGFTLLGGTLPSKTMHEVLYSRYFDQVAGLMDEKYEINLRIIAAKAVTALVEWERERLKEEDAEDNEEDMSTVLDSMLALLDDRNKFKGKVDLKKQKKTLKSLIAFVEESSQMETETVVVRATPVVLGTWTQIFRMDRFRALLGEGFMNHLEENKNLMHIFDYFVDTSMPILPTMTKQERRLSLSESSKAATKARSSLRSIRESEAVHAAE